MDNPHRVHPVDSSPNMYSSDQEQQPYPPKYVMLGEDKNDSQGLRPPPYRRNIPRYHSTNPHKKKSGGKKCFRCICCCYCFLILLILILVGLTAGLFYVFNPKIPTYKVDDMSVAAFNVQKDFSLYTKFIVTVKADNPNTKIGINYEKASSVKVGYQGSTLSSGHLPVFYQGHNNVTLIKVTLDGVSSFGSGLQEVYADKRKGKKIPLFIEVKAPVKIVMANFPLKSITVFANISLVVDDLSPNAKINILSSKQDIKVRFSEDPLLEYKVM
ncbi:hypothetical protein ACHQM5_003039 [Ranunculus cassubicifolius]